MPDYSIWPQFADVSARLASAGVTLRGDAEGRTGELLSAVICEIERETRQQFIADEDVSTRTFDGSGTAALDVDPFVELSGSSIGAVYGVSEQGKPKTRIYIQSSVGSGAFGASCGAFPAGRQNVKVTARWGFADAIPADVWEAVCSEAALRVAGEALFVVNTSASGAVGFIIEEQYGDQRVKFGQAKADYTGWHSAFVRACKAYKRSQSPARKKLKGPML